MRRILAWFIVLLALTPISLRADPPVAAARLIAGPEISLGDPTKMQPWPGEPLSPWRPAVATDGSDVLIVFTTAHRLCAVRFDASLRRLTPAPIILDERFEGELRLFWVDGNYVLFASRPSWPISELRVYRLTRAAQIIDSRLIEGADALGSGFDVTHDGEAFLVTRSDSLLRLTKDFRVAARRALRALVAGTRALATGLRRTVILSADRNGVDLRFFDHRTQEVSAPVSVTPGVGLRSRSNARIVRSGSEYVALWVDTIAAPSSTLWMARFSLTGVLIAPPQRLANSTSYGVEASLTVLDGGDVFISHDVDSHYANVTEARRYRRGAVLDDPPFRFPSGAVEAIQTADRTVFAIDDDLKAYRVPPSGASRGGMLAATTLFYVSEDERLRGAIARGNEIAVLHDDGPDTLLTFLRRDGTVSEEIASSSQGNRDEELLSDGESLFHFGTHYFSTFQRVSPPGDPITLPGHWHTGALWTGSSFATVWPDDTLTRLRMTHLDRDGRILSSCDLPAESLPMDPLKRPHLSLLKVEDELWVLAGGGGREIRLTRVEGTGCSARTVESVVVPAATSEPSWNVRLEAARSETTGTLALVLWGLVPSENGGYYVIALRRADGSFAIGEAPPGRQVFDFLKLVAVGPYFLAAYQGFHGDQYTQAVRMLDDDGRVLDELDLGEPTDYLERPVFVSLTSKELYLFYTRRVEEPPYFGARRVFARHLTIEEESDRRRAVRH